MSHRNPISTDKPFSTIKLRAALMTKKVNQWDMSSVRTLFKPSYKHKAMFSNGLFRLTITTSVQRHSVPVNHSWKFPSPTSNFLSQYSNLSNPTMSWRTHPCVSYFKWQIVICEPKMILYSLLPHVTLFHSHGMSDIRWRGKCPWYSDGLKIIMFHQKYN